MPALKKDRTKKDHADDAAQEKCRNKEEQGDSTYDMFQVRLPDEQQDAERPSGQLKLTFGHISLSSWKERGFLNRKKSRFFPQLFRAVRSIIAVALFSPESRLMLNRVLNPVTVALFCLAIAVSIWGQSINGVLFLLQRNQPADNCDTVDIMQQMPFAAALLKAHLINGINATIWNLEHTAYYGVSSAAAIYSNVTKGICNVYDQVSSPNMTGNTTKLLVELEQERSRANSFENILSKIDHTLHASKVLSENKTSPFDGDMTSSQSWSISPLCQNFATATRNVSYALRRINGTVIEARGKLVELASLNLPTLNMSSVSGSGDFSSPAGLQIYRCSQRWILGFCCSGLIVIIIAMMCSRESFHRRINESPGVEEKQLEEKFSALELKPSVTSGFPVFLCGALCKLCFGCQHVQCQDRISRSITSCFTGMMVQLLGFAVVLSIASISFADVLNKINGFDSFHIQDGVASQLSSIYGRFESNFNDKCFDIILQLINELNLNQVNLASNISSKLNFSIDIGSPFIPGIAYENMNLAFPIINGSSAESSSVCHPQAFQTTTLFFSKWHSFITMMWCTSISLFIMWILGIAIVCGSEVYHVRGTGMHS